VRPLEGLTVVAVEQAIAAPLASRHLADLGARVIKIERPGTGDFARTYDTTVKGMASYFVWLNRGKESLTLDLKHPAAADVLHRLLDRADVFLHNLAPGAVDRLGFGAEALRSRNPRLIGCVISGYGSTGPYRDRRAYDLLLQADAGVMSLTGTPEDPCRAGLPVADIACGMYAFSGILTALLVRSQTGAGRWMEVSLLDAVAEWLSFSAYYAAYGGVTPQRSGASHPTLTPYGPFATGGGETIYLSVQNEREWARFCAEVLERPELTTDLRFDSNPKRLQNRTQVHAIVESVLARYDAEEVIRRLEAAQIAWSKLNSIDRLFDHPQLAARGRWREVASPVGPLRALLPPVTMDGVDPAMGEVPAVGQHTEAILAELGLDAAAIAQLRGAGAL